MTRIHPNHAKDPSCCLAGGRSLILMKGRDTSAHWHSETLTTKSVVLVGMAPEELMLDLNVDEAKILGIRGGAELRVETA